MSLRVCSRDGSIFFPVKAAVKIVSLCALSRQREIGKTSSTCRNIARYSRTSARGEPSKASPSLPLSLFHSLPLSLFLSLSLSLFLLPSAYLCLSLLRYSNASLQRYMEKHGVKADSSAFKLVRKRPSVLSCTLYSCPVFFFFFVVGSLSDSW